MHAVRSLIQTELAPLMRETGKKLIIAGVAALGAKLAAGHPLLAFAAGLAAVIFAMACEQLLGQEPTFAVAAN